MTICVTNWCQVTAIKAQPMRACEQLNHYTYWTFGSHIKTGLSQQFDGRRLDPISTTHSQRTYFLGYVAQIYETPLLSIVMTQYDILKGWEYAAQHVGAMDSWQ